MGLFSQLRRIAQAALLIVIPMQAGAQQPQLPALYDVTGVAQDDTLNLRAEPNARADILGSLPPDRQNLQILEITENGDWARISMSETTGWAATRFLQAQPERPAGQLPVPLRCYGTEPFWGLHIPTADFAEFERPPARERPFTVTYQGAAMGGSSSDVGAILGSDDGHATVVLRRESCNDGMSDADFGLSVRVLISEGGETQMYAGCCSLTGP